jgi:hypothetical protein
MVFLMEASLYTLMRDFNRGNSTAHVATDLFHYFIFDIYIPQEFFSEFAVDIYLHNITYMRTLG